jgi:hypothetical protein
VAAWIGRRWREETKRASVAALGDDRGAWLPGAGGAWAIERDDGWVPCERPGWTERDGYGWFRPLVGLEGAYQAAKYPTPAVELHPVALAEFVAVSFGRRWHDGGGRWRGIRRRAEEIELDGASSEAAPTGYDEGRNIGRCGPGDAPDLDAVAPGLGVERCRACGASGEHDCERRPAPDWVGWRLARSAPIERIEAAASAAGGVVEQGRLVVPRAAAAALLREWHAARRAARAAKTGDQPLGG